MDYRQQIEPIVMEDAPIPDTVEDFIEWCRQEYASYEGNTYEETLSTNDPIELANKVYRAWTEYCR